MTVTVSQTRYIKLEQRLHLMTRHAACLAERLKDATASEEQRNYDRSRTWCDRQEDYEFATTMLRVVSPTLRSLEKKFNGHQEESKNETPQVDPTVRKNDRQDEQRRSDDRHV